MGRGKREEGPKPKKSEGINSVEEENVWEDQLVGGEIILW